MTDDYIYRFKLSQAQAARSFAEAAKDRPTIKTEDNAQPVIPPPRAAFIPRPALAPPGMMGSRLTQEAIDWKEKERLAMEARAAQPYAPKLRRWGEFTMDDLSLKPFALDPNKKHGHEI